MSLEFWLIFVCVWAIVQPVVLVALFLREVRPLIRAVIAKNAQEVVIMEKAATPRLRREREPNEPPIRALGL